MASRIRSIASTGAVLALVLSAESRAQVYVANADGASVSAINFATNSVLTSIAVGAEPRNLAVTPSQLQVYVPNRGSNTVSVISTAANTVTTTISDASLNGPYAAAVTPSGSEVWVVNKSGSSITIIATASNTVVATVSDPCISSPEAIAMNPALGEAYVVNRGAGTVCRVDRASRAVTGSIVVGGEPRYAVVLPGGGALLVSRATGNAIARVDTATSAVTYLSVSGTPRNMAITRDGSKVYAALQNAEVAVIDTATNGVNLVTVPGASSTYGVALVESIARAYVTDESSSVVHVLNTTNDTPITGPGLPIASATFQTPRAIAAGGPAAPAGAVPIPVFGALGALLLSVGLATAGTLLLARGASAS